MITTVTLNTSIDKAYQLTTPLVDGTVMRVAHCIDNAGGKGLNAARAVATLQEDVIASGFVGGHNGSLLRDLLDKDGITHDFVVVAEETRCCINVLDPSGESTEFLEPGRPVSDEEIAAMHRKLAELARKSEVLTFNGSLPKNMPKDAYTELIALVQAENCICLLDTSGASLKSVIAGVAAGAAAGSISGAPLTTAATFESNIGQPTLIKPNTDEIAQIVGAPLTTLADIAKAANSLVRQGIPYVVVSLGKDGALMATADGVFKGTAPVIEVINPVGAGDTMVGAFAVALKRGYAAEDCLSFAMSCATANCLSAKTGSFDLAVAEKLRADTHVERL